MNLIAKKYIINSFRIFGLDVATFVPRPNPILYHNTDVLFDVGANAGQYALRARKLVGYRNKIVSFEPLPDAYAVLTKSAKKDKNWIVHERCAVGASAGEVEINIAKNSESSSLLPMLAAHSDAAPESIYVGKTTTKLITLDSVFKLYVQENQRVFLKIDTQGYEKQVLAGAKESLKHIHCVQLELSVVPLYDSQDLYEHFFEFFKTEGFELWSLHRVFDDQKTGRMLQFDAIFVRCQ